MKARFSFLFALVMVLGLASCGKDYTCSCTVDFGTGDSTFSFTYENTTEEEATSGCTSVETNYKVTDPGASCNVQ